MSTFQFDGEKSQANLHQHGINFHHAQALWQDQVTTARRVNHEAKRINVDFPAWVVESLYREAARIGVTRQSINKVWLVERLRAEAAIKPLKSDNASGAL